MRLTLAQINELSREEFVRVLGPVFEHSPWIAEAAWPRRPFPDLDSLHRALCESVEQASEARQLELIRAHPDLVDRAARVGALTAASAREQAAAGLDHLTSEEVALFQRNNQTYRDRFGFPFIICARLNKKQAILAGFDSRLNNSRDEEIQIALAEIAQIARLRLEDLVQPF
jgi:OHCU decarboxylase